MGLPAEVYERLRDALLRCDVFRNDDALAAVFVDARISQWKAGLPEASSDEVRVGNVVAYLLKKRDAEGENALVLFLQALSRRYDSRDALHGELATLAKAVEDYAPAPGTRQWEVTLDRYQERVRKRYNTMHVLGMGGQYRSVPLEGIYTDVYLLEQPAHWRYGDDLSSLLTEEKGKRQDGLELVKQLDTQILVIRGKPGAGKTTFLKHLALQAARGKLGDYVPIFVELRKWADGTLLDFLAGPFAGCFVNPRVDVEHLLKTGRALILLDGLDEIGEKGQRNLIRELEAFSERYLDCHILLTYRTGTPLYLERSQTVQVADFTDDQVRAFAMHWFGAEKAKAAQFIGQIERDARLHDLSRTPLLLGLLCLSFDKPGAFPQKRTDLYRDALDKLLVQLDKFSKNIKRDTQLDLRHKRQLFAHIAYATFEQDEPFIHQERLEALIEAYLTAEQIAIGADSMLEALEEQHGILVKQAYGVYSFEHSMYQEYYTARHIFHNADRDIFSQLLSHAHEDSWQEVILMVAEMLLNADEFFEVFLARLAAMVKGDEKLVEFLGWAERKADSVDVRYKPAAVRALYVSFVRDVLDLDLDIGSAINLAHARNRAFDHALAFARAIDLAIDRNLVSRINLVHASARAIDCCYDRFHAIDRDCDLALALDLALDHARARYRYLALARDLARDMGETELYNALSTLAFPDEDTPAETWEAFEAQLQGIMIKHRDVGHVWGFTKEQAQMLEDYFGAAELLVACLDVAYVTDREAIEARLLLPPKEG
jgi:hypothetical protein